ncbi:MAG: AAA family ATPase [Lachnospiraceae bacterium]
MDKVLNWEDIETSPIGFFFSEMKNVEQNPKFHGEGNVYIHTQMVCAELIKKPEFWILDQTQRIGLFTAALFHDVGKIRTTKLEDDKWVSPHHSSIGSLMTREFLWKTCGLCGNKERQQLRELICTLVRYHMLPVHLLDQKDPERKARQVAAMGELVSDFSWKLLCLLSEADMKGRIAPNIDEQLEKIELCRILTEEADCYDKPYLFQDDYTKHAYLNGRNVMPNQSLYDDTWGEIILMSGLPGTGKDTWIRENIPEYPMISLDKIRREMNVKPTDNQGIVIQKAQECAKVYLRAHQSFVWNATDITKDTRQKQIRLFERYGAMVRIIYLETNWGTQLERNSSRLDEVPVAAIEKMLRKTVPPMPEEAMTVEWKIC